MDVRTTPLGRIVVGCAIEVHRVLGPGLFESTYDHCYAADRRGLRYERQLVLPVRYKDLQLDCGYRIDYLIESELLVEIKAVERILPVHKAQLRTCMPVR